MIMVTNDIFWKRQVEIAKKTMKMPDAILGVIGGQTKAEAREILRIERDRLAAVKKQRRKSK
jgi:hypothetical protein